MIFNNTWAWYLHAENWSYFKLIEPIYVAFFSSFKTTLLVSFTYGPWRTGAMSIELLRQIYVIYFKTDGLNWLWRVTDKMNWQKVKLDHALQNRFWFSFLIYSIILVNMENLKFEWDSDRHSTGRSILAQHLVMICTFIFFLFLIKKTNQCFSIYPNSTFANFQSD